MAAVVASALWKRGVITPAAQTQGEGSRRRADSRREERRKCSGTGERERERESERERVRERGIGRDRDGEREREKQKKTAREGVETGPPRRRRTATPRPALRARSAAHQPPRARGWPGRMPPGGLGARRSDLLFLSILSKRGSGFRVRALRFRGRESWFRARGLGFNFRFSDLRFEVQHLQFRASSKYVFLGSLLVHCRSSQYRSGLPIRCAFRLEGLGFRV